MAMSSPDIVGWAHDRAKRASRQRRPGAAPVDPAETIHKHTVVAERHGVFGDLRHEVDFGERMSRHVTKREWLEDVSGPGKP